MSFICSITLSSGQVQAKNEQPQVFYDSVNTANGAVSMTTLAYLGPNQLIILTFKQTR